MTHKRRREAQRAARFSGPLQRRLLLLLLALWLTVLVMPKGGFVPDDYRPGDIVLRDIKAPRDFLVPEPALTEKKRQEAATAVVAVYDYDPRPGRMLLKNLHDVLVALRPLPEESHETQEMTEAPPERVAMTTPLGQADIEALLETELSTEQLALLQHLAANDDFVTRMGGVSHTALRQRTVASLDLFRGNWRGVMTVRDLATQQEYRIERADEVIGLSDALDQLRLALTTPAVRRNDLDAFLALLQKLLRPSLTFNQSETENRRLAAAEAVQPVVQQVKRGEMIVREGDRASDEQIRRLQALRDSADLAKGVRTAIGLFGAIALLFWVVHHFARRNIRKYAPNTRDLLFMVLVFGVLFMLLKVGIFVSGAMQSAFPYIDSACYYYALPFAAGAMLVRVVLNSEVALVFSILLCLMIGLLFGDNLFMAFYALAGSLTAAHWVRHSKARSNLYRAGGYLSLVNLLMVLAIHAVGGHPYDSQLLYRLGFAAVGGFICAVIVNGTIALIESVFKYTTDFKLMELANMNTPILRELMIQAPGTYHHSIVVGNLVENAAEAIGANPLLARVAAYYHDIGKIRKPLYFAENIRGQENRHDKLAPSMSALILISHLKDGVELARENKLGRELIDIIRQHHGTSLIKFFYDKALQRDKDGQVNEQDYRYPGPKPQTREAALIMLADAVEAAGRTLSDPTPARIQGMVQKIINKIFIDGQLDECELTLKDLHEIAKSFNRILSGIFHQRVEYPEPAYKERDAKREVKKKTGEDLPRESTDEPVVPAAAPAAGSADDLKRLGMS